MDKIKYSQKSTLLTIDGKSNSLVLDLLTREVLLIPNSQKEEYCTKYNKITSVYERFKHQLDSLEIISTWLFLTFSCNLACTYCFETKKNEEKNDYMSTETVDRICRHLNKVRNASLKRFELVYFGGEPLLNYSGLIYAIKKFNSELKGKVCHKLITNGVNLFPERAMELIKNGVSVIQITLDGNSAVHDARKPTIYGTGSYKTILENIKGVLAINQEFTLIIRINVDYNNYNSVLAVLTEEKNVFSDPRIYIDVGKVCSHTFCRDYPDVMSRNEFSLFYEHLIIEIYKMDLKAIPPFNGGCSRNKKSAFFFSPQGKLFKCPAVVSDSCSPIQNVLPTIQDRCKDCEFLLVCGGGCNLNKSCSKEPSCGYEFMRRDLVAYYKAKYQKQLSTI